MITSQKVSSIFMKGGHAMGVIFRQWIRQAHPPEFVEGAKLIRPTPQAWPPPTFHPLVARYAYTLPDGLFASSSIILHDLDRASTKSNLDNR